MGLNPTRDETSDDYRDLNAIGVEGATVVQTPDDMTSSGNGHGVKVIPDTMDDAITADVIVSQKGDAHIPEQNSRVIIAYRPSEQPVVLGQRYSVDDSIPDVQPGERVVSHPTSDATIRYTTDGAIKITGDSDVVINDGNKQAVTNVEASGTNEHGGITGITVTRSSSVYLP